MSQDTINKLREKLREIQETAQWAIDWQVQGESYLGWRSLCEIIDICESVLENES